ncbi:hypothetical protein Dimus_022742 [Dionaea muscipula]
MSLLTQLNAQGPLSSPACCYGYKLRNNVVRHYSHILVIYLLSKTCYVFLMQHRKHLVTASYVDDSLLKLDSDAKCAGVTILGEMGLDPGIGKSSRKLVASYNCIFFNFI